MREEEKFKKNVNSFMNTVGEFMEEANGIFAKRGTRLKRLEDENKELKRKVAVLENRVRGLTSDMVPTQ